VTAVTPPDPSIQHLKGEAMQIFKSQLTLLLVLTLGTTLIAGSGSLHKRRAEAFPKPDENKAIEKIVESALQPVIAQPGFTGITIGVRRDGKDFLYHYGDLKSKGNRTPPDSKTLYMIGSVTKTFTATQLALYAQQGLVTMDQPFQKNIPALYQAPPADPKSTITLEQLATHSAGLKRDSCAKFGPDSNSANAPSTPNDGFTLEDAELDPEIPGCTPLVPFYKDWYTATQAYEEYRCQNGYAGCLLISLPGAKHTYSNFGFGLLGLSLAKGGSWARLLRKDITDPLQMSDTGIRSQLTDEQLGRRATGHKGDGKAVPDDELEASTIPTLAAGGALWSTPDDLMRWMTYTMGESSTSLSSLLTTVLKKRHTFAGDHHLINKPGQTDSMALGWQYTPLNRGVAKTEVVCKNGGTPGFNSYVGFIPKKSTGVFIMANFKFAKNFGAGDLGLSILRELDKESKR
jgi:CubicO group peptidase (beta-lactamase class C family)